MKLTHNLKKLREAKGWQRKDLVQAAQSKGYTGIGFPNLDQWEDQRMIPRFSTVLQLCELLGCNTTDFFNSPKLKKQNEKNRSRKTSR